MLKYVWIHWGSRHFIKELEPCVTLDKRLANRLKYNVYIQIGSFRRMTKILIGSLREGENPYQSRFPAEELDLKLDSGALDGEVEVRGVIARFSSHIAMNATLAFRVEFECARCLKSFVRDYRIPLRSRYQQVEALRPGWEVDPDVRFISYSARELDLLPEIRETILFTLPLVPLCREDCPGLCPRCGADLSLGPCGCPQAGAEPDSPWEPLRKLVT